MKGEALTLAPYEQLLIAVLILLVTVKIVYSLFCIHRGALSYRLEIRRAGSRLERKHWKRQLKIYYLSCLPFISPERAKAICELFYRGRHRDKTGKVHLSAILAPTVSGILLSMACLFSLTFAWFTASTQSTLPKISAASYQLSQTVTVKASENEAAAVGTTVSRGENGAYTLKKGVTYEICLKVTNDSTATTGFGKIEDYSTHGVLYTTEVIKKGAADFSFTLTPENDLTVCFYASWGKPSDIEDPVKNGDVVGSAGTENGTQNGAEAGGQKEQRATSSQSKALVAAQKAKTSKNSNNAATSAAAAASSNSSSTKSGEGAGSSRSAATATVSKSSTSDSGQNSAFNSTAESSVSGNAASSNVLDTTP